MAGVPDDAGEREPRDWNALLQRVLAPFRSEAAAFRVLLATVALFAAIIVVIVVLRAIL
jgi:hypothetical protein